MSETVKPVLEYRCSQKESEKYKAKGFDASEPIYWIGDAAFGLSDILAARVTNRPLRPTPCKVNLPGDVTRLLLLDVVEVTPSETGSYRDEYPDFYVEGWMFEENFNPTVHQFNRIRLYVRMCDCEKIIFAELQRISEVPDRRKASRITLIQDDCDFHYDEG